MGLLALQMGSDHLQHRHYCTPLSGKEASLVFQPCILPDLHGIPWWTLPTKVSGRVAPYDKSHH